MLFLWGSPGDPVVEFYQRKQPAGEVGPFHVGIDHATGTVSIIAGTDLLGHLRASSDGLTAKEAGRHVEGGNERARTEKARRKLDDLVGRKLAHRKPGDIVRGAVTAPDRY